MPDIAPRSSFADTRAWLRALPAMTAAAAPADVLDPTHTPSPLFLRWLEDAVAAGVPEPQAAVLSTTEDGGRVDARVLTLKDVDERGWWFSGSVDSPKGRQLAANPSAALTFYWAGVGRQVRVRGHAEPGEARVSARDYLERSVTARAVAAASRQSEVLADPGRVRPRGRRGGLPDRGRPGPRRAGLAGLVPGPGQRRVLARRPGAQTPTVAVRAARAVRELVDHWVDYRRPVAVTRTSERECA
ncbi:pyridoxine/pyridoxamine 5'-phosphate oxidase [Rhodococcus sp. PvR044]